MLRCPASFPLRRLLAQCRMGRPNPPTRNRQWQTSVLRIGLVGSPFLPVLTLFHTHGLNSAWIKGSYKSCLHGHVSTKQWVHNILRPDRYTLSWSRAMSQRMKFELLQILVGMWLNPGQQSLKRHRQTNRERTMQWQWFWKWMGTRWCCLVLHEQYTEHFSNSRDR